MEVFRSGDYGAKGRYSDRDLDQIVADYQPDLLEAPLTFDHAQSGPAYGWVAGLRRRGDRLIALFRHVPEAVRALMQSGAYKRRSVELLRALPQTGRPYLRAVSLLGAATPQVKGLRDVCFATEDEAAQIAFAEEPPSANAATPGDTVQDLRRQVEEGRLALMFSELRREGYCLAEDDAAALGRLLASAHAGGQEHFADNPDGDAIAWLQGFLRRTLQRAPLGVVDMPVAGAVANGGAPGVAFCDRTAPASFALHHAAVALQQGQAGLTYRDALLQASHRNTTTH